MLLLTILIFALALATLLAVLLAGRPGAAAAMIVASFLLEALLITPPAIAMGLQIYPADVVFVLLLAAAALRYAGGRARAHVPGSLLLLGLLLLVALARGFLAYGLKPAGVEGRGSFYFLSGAVYFSSFSWTGAARRRVISLWLGACLALVALACFRWAVTVAGLPLATQWEQVSGSHVRVLNASQAAFLLAGFFASVFLNLSRQGPRWQRKAFYLLGPVLVLLQHRTVWVQMIVGALWLARSDQRFRRHAAAALAAMAVLAALLTWSLFGRQSEAAVESLRESAADNETFLWRAAGWRELLFNNPARNPINDAIGQPFGTGFERQIELGTVDVHPHSYYLEAFLRAGTSGLALLLLLYLRYFRRWRARALAWRNWAYPDARFWALVLLLQLLYFFTYAPSYDQSILAGIAFAALPRTTVHPAWTPAKASQPTCALA